MEAPLLVILLLGALAVGIVIGILVRSSRAASEIANVHARAVASDAVAGGLREQLNLARASDAERLERERRDQSVLHALAPVRETLSSMQRQVSELERERGAQYGAIAAQLRASHEQGELLRNTTESLAGALRSNATRGVWGETALRRVVEAAGLTRHVDFTLQTSVQTSQAGEDATGRPDMVIWLPGDKAIAVDAKVPLDAYLQAVAIPETSSGTDLIRRRTLMLGHVKAVRSHIDALAKKAYWTGLPSAPEFVICFIPNESLLAAALDADPTLLDYAFGKRVALASPVNLWTVLKTVALTWTQQDVSTEARQLLELGTTLYERLGSLSGHTETLRRSIEKTVESYNAMIGSLESRVLVTARKFPGIDESKLLASPGAVTASPRPLTSPEMLEGLNAEEGTEADLGELRERISRDGSH